MYFVNRTIFRCSIASFTSANCAPKDTSVGVLPASLYLHNSVDLLYHEIISHYHIILDSRCHIINWYHNNSSWQMCTRWCTLASGLDNFCIPLQSDITLISNTHKYFLNFMITHLTADAYTWKLCLEFSSGDTVDLKMKKIGCRHIPTI